MTHHDHAHDHDGDEGEEVELSEGMPVENEDGEPLGKLGGLLMEEDEEEAEFLILTTAAGDKLVPFESVLGVGDGKLVLDVPSDNVKRFPTVREEGPTDDEIELAYKVYDEGASDE